jgi:Ca-activated chloride channel homolog
MVCLGKARLSVLAFLLFCATVVPAAAQSAPESSVRITSPLGRTGLVTRLRIVAQISLPAGVTLSPVEFFVDGALVGTVVEGPIYAVDWTDDNPFERREIVVQAADSTGHALRDVVVLPPFEVAEKAEVKAILLETGVYDKVGDVVNDVSETDFSVAEDGVQQTIDLVTQETVPTDLLLLVDNSQSMARRMDFVRRATERLLQNLRASDRAIVAPFNARVGTITGPTNDRRTISEAIASMRAGGGTALLDSIVEATRLMRQPDRRQIIVLITDGFDENSKAVVSDARRAVQEAQTTVYAVGIGGAGGLSLRGQNTLEDIVKVTGGRVFFPPRELDVVRAAEAVSADTRNRYLVTYTPRNQRRDGKWRAIEVTVPGDRIVRTRAGYFAPAPTPIRYTTEFTVLDSDRRYADVTAQDLDVYENGVLQKVDTFQEAVDPVAIVLALDQSGSMKKSTDLVKQTARDFVTAVRPEDSLALVTFADRPRYEHALGTERKWSFDAIEKYTPNGGTALYDAVWNSLNTLKGVKGRRAVVVLSDGRDENNPGTAPGSIHTLDDVMKLAEEVDAQLYMVGFGATADRPVLDRLADATGGQAYYALDADNLGAQFQRIIRDLRRRYILGYTSTDSTHDGEWRSVEIRPKAPGYYSLSGGGYFAPFD